ncbi:MAG: RlmE family RNA methyltransferase [Desulfobacterales bacterium]|nr:RlmE family RNA methyltransferase [Desulfobacterales bacterium]
MKPWEDHYSRQAKKEGFPARSIYKIQEIHRKYNLIRKGDRVLDLGCHPGSWLKFSAGLTGDRGHVIGIDLKPVSIKLPAHVRTYTGDIMRFDEDLAASVGNGFNVVLSDMAPNTTGSRETDAARSFHLCMLALSIAQTRLIRGGSFVCKIFHGEDFKNFSASVKSSFYQYKVFKPSASRKASREIFIIGLGKKIGGYRVWT